METIREDLVAERIAIDSYQEIIRYLGDNDSYKRRVVKEILAQEEHAQDLKTLIESLGRDEDLGQELRRAS